MKKIGKMYVWLGSRKMTWILCGIGIASAVLSFCFFPGIIPMHFANGVADGFGKKIEIFLFPSLLFDYHGFKWNGKDKIFFDTFQIFSDRAAVQSLY